MSDESERRVSAVMQAIAHLPGRLGPAYAPEEIFEGAVKGGALQLMAMSGCDPANVADLLEGMAEAFRAVDPQRPLPN